MKEGKEKLNMSINDVVSIEAALDIRRPLRSIVRRWCKGWMGFTRVIPF
jgi:hypothetical protein